MTIDTDLFFSILRRIKRHEIQLNWKDVSYNLQGNRQILDNVCGSAKPGELTGILGLVGSGKTTLLNILSGTIDLHKKDELTGEVLANGSKRDRQWRHEIAYVEQAAFTYPYFRVEEVLMQYADLKLGALCSYAEKRVIVGYLIERLGLSRVRYSKVGNERNRGISGAELRLLLISLQLLSHPSVLFLDEPTAELDAARGIELIQFLKEICTNTNMTIIMSIHQPRADVWKMIDRVTFLILGHMAYEGPAREATTYFESQYGLKFSEHIHYTDVILDFLLKQEKAGDIELFTDNRFRQITPYSGTVDAPQTEKFMNGFWKEFAILHNRYLVSLFRDKVTLISNITQAFILSFFVSFAFFQLGNDFEGVLDQIGVFYYISATLLTAIGMPLWDAFAEDRQIITKDLRSGLYRVISCYIAKCAAVFPLSIALMLIFVIPVYYITGMVGTFYRVLMFLTLAFALRCSAIAFGLMIAAFSNTVYTGLIFGPMLIILFILFGGTSADTNDMPPELDWIKFLSVVYYATQGMAQNEFTDQEFVTPLGETVDGTYYLELLGLDEISEGFCILALFGFTLLFFLIGYGGLIWTTRRNSGMI